MKTLKRWLFRRLGRGRYLYLVSWGYRLAYRAGWLRRDPDYAFHYFAARLVRPGDYVIDIGANLGYYSLIFAGRVGPAGRLWSVEPVPLYRDILRRHVGARPQVEIVPYALGAASATVRMGVPGNDPHRHGLTRILGREEARSLNDTFEVEVRPPADVFGDPGRLDYIKCDVEGYEIHILPLMEDMLRRYRPLVQVELAPENRAPLFALFAGLGYQAFDLVDGRLHPLSGAAAPSSGDVLFAPEEAVGRLTS